MLQNTPKFLKIFSDKPPRPPITSLIPHFFLHTHLIMITCFTIFPAWSFTTRNSKGFGGHTNGTFHSQFFFFGASNQFTANFLQRFYIAASQRNTNFVHCRTFLQNLKNYFQQIPRLQYNYILHV